MDSFFHFFDVFAVLNSGFINDWVKKLITSHFDLSLQKYTLF